MARPNSIVWFERLYLGSWVVSLLALAINWNATLEKLSFDPSARRLGMGMMTNILIAGIALGALITLVLWYFTARQHSVVAKWFVVAFFILGLFGIPGIITLFSNGEMISALLQVAVFALHAAAVVMLFRRDARIWFGEVKDDTDTSVKDVFS